MSADGTIPESRTSATTSNWYTPPYIIEPARAFLGGAIDLDPASCALANRTVGARRIITEAEDALSCDWGSGRSIFCNPPTPPRPFWGLVNGAVRPGRGVPGTYERAVFIGYSIEVLQQFQLGDYIDGWHLCIPSKRIPFQTTAEDRRRTLTMRFSKTQDELAKATGEKRSQLVKKIDALAGAIAVLKNVAPDTLVTGDAPAHASVLLGWGPREEWVEAMSGVGMCR
jgi:hypothetical protein